MNSSFEEVIEYVLLLGVICFLLVYLKKFNKN